MNSSVLDNKLAVTFFVLSQMLIFSHTAFYSTPITYLIFGLPTTLTFLLLTTKRDPRYIYTYCMSLVIFSSGYTVTNVLFEYNLGFSAGANDEIKYYFWIKEIINNLENTGNLETNRSRYIGYTYPIALIANLIGDSETFSIYWIKIYSLSIFSFLPIAIYKTSKSIKPDSNHLRNTITTILLSGTALYYGSVGVRDALFTILLTIFSLVWLNTRINQYLKVSLSLVIILITYSVRTEASIFLALATIYITIHIFLTERKSSLLPIPLAIVALIVPLLLINGNRVATITTEFSELYSFYNQMAMENTESEARIRSMPTPIRESTLAAYGILGTFPPELTLKAVNYKRDYMIVRDQNEVFDIVPRYNLNIGRLLKWVGQYSWYFSLGFLFASFLQRRIKSQRPPNTSNSHLTPVVAINFLYIVAISQFTFELGRLHAPYPLLTLLSVIFYYDNNSKKQRARNTVLILLSILTLHCVYFALKV